MVVYCSNVDCLSSVALYRDLIRRGYENVRRYSGGLLEWEDAGLPLEGEFVDAEPGMTFDGATEAARTVTRTPPRSRRAAGLVRDRGPRAQR